MNVLTKKERLRKNIIKVWENKWKILEGIWYNHIVFYFNKMHWARNLVENRRIECFTCPHLDNEGKGDNVVLKGKPACSICGCNILEKTACLSCECADQTNVRWNAVRVKNEYLIESKLDG